MIRGIIGSSLKFQFLVVVLAAVVMIVGIVQLGNLPVDVLPEFSPPYVEIQTEALGLSAEEVEEMITIPMEQDLLAGVAWADVIRSESVPGLSSVVVFFEPGTDIFRARQMVSERLAQAAVGLPHVSKPPTMIQPLSSASRFLIVGLSSQDLSLIQMSVLARWVIAPRLMGVPGVSTVAIWGQRERQLQVQVDPERLRAQGVSLEQVVETTGNALWVSSLTFLEASTPGTGGFIDTPQQRLVAWHVLPISSPEELARVPVEDADGLLLQDVAEVVEDHQPLIGDAVINDSPNLLLVIEKLPGINTLDVTQGVEEALDALRPGFTGIEFDASLFRPATFIETAIANLTRTLIIGALLVMLVLGAFLYGWRAALISLVAIPLSLVAALLVLYLRGATFNAMVLAGLVIALGAVVDEAVVDVEHSLRRLRQNRREGSASAESVILQAAAEMRGASLFATLITLLAVLPVFFVEDVSGALFQPLAVSYVLAVLAALAVALTVTPALSLILLANAPEGRESPLIPWLQRGYERLLARTVQGPRLAYATIAVLVVAGVAALPFLRPAQLLPSFREPYLTIRLEAAPSTSHPEMNRIVARMSAELRAIPGARNVGAHVGRAVFGDRVVGINSADLWVSIEPQADYDATVAAVREAVDGYTGLAGEVQTYLQQVLSSPQASAGDAITVRVFGEDNEGLRAEAEKVRQALAGIAGVVDPHVILPIEEPTLEIRVDLAAAQTYGIKPGDVRRAAAILLSGLQVGSLFEEQKVFDVVVWGTPETRDSLTDVRELLIETPGGGHVRLEEVADVRLVARPAVIRHEATSAYMDVGLGVRGRDADAVMRDVEAALKTVPFSLEYHAEVLGDYATRQAAQQRIIIAGVVALVGIFLLLQASAESWRLAAATFLTLPAALAGGVLAAFLGGGALSLVALFGLLAVLGIGVRNGVLLVRRCQLLEQEGETFGPALVLRGSRERLAPVLMTALATGLALAPFVLFGDIPGHEIVRPIAVIILGGLVTSTLLNLFVMPALYLRFGASREADLGLLQAATATVMVVILAIASLPLSACAQTPTAPEKVQPAHVEPIEGTDLKRVVLTEKAAERLGIETAPVREEQVVRTRTVGGVVVAAPEGEGAGPDTVWVRVLLTESELGMVDRSQAARVLSLDDDEQESGEGEGLAAEADERPGGDDAEDDDSTEAVLYYAVDNADNRLVPGQRVFVELVLSSSGTPRIVVPYAAVIYDTQGETWVYTNPESRVFVRWPIVVDYIEDELAFLSVGPPSGTAVVTVGAAELFGTETGVSK
jgi:CzcA family heavy metal efflux pump